ncbi:MAG: acyltransferase family protein [Cyanobacteria bacterium P01_D01_bin.14]
MKKIKQRLYYLDIARGFAIFGMFTQHCMIVHEVSGGEGESLFANVMTLLGTAPSAPVFMMIMGIFSAKSKTDPLKLMLRGIKLLVLGFALNLFRFTMPLLVAMLLLDSGELQLTGDNTLVKLSFYVDILQLAGLSLIFCALLKKIAVPRKSILLLIFIILFVSPFLWGLFEGNLVSALFWGEADNVTFPFFPWAVYPLLGISLSQCLTDSSVLDQNLKKIRYCGFILAVLGALMLLLSTLKVLAFNIISPTGDYFRSGASIHFLIIGFILSWLPICRWSEQTFTVENSIIQVLIFWSRNVTAIYFIQWTLFGWSMLIFGTNQQNAPVSAAIGLAVLLATHFSVKKAWIRNLFSWV